MLSFRASPSNESESQLRIVALIARILMGALFVFASVSYFAKLFEEQVVEGALKTFNEGVAASVYLLPLAKALELICGLAFLANRFVPLATILIAPILVNIFFINWFMLPSGLPLAIFLVVANSLVAWQHRAAYRPLFEARS